MLDDFFGRALITGGAAAVIGSLSGASPAWLPVSLLSKERERKFIPASLRLLYRCPTFPVRGADGAPRRGFGRQASRCLAGSGDNRESQAAPGPRMCSRRREIVPPHFRGRPHTGRSPAAPPSRKGSEITTLNPGELLCRVHLRAKTQSSLRAPERVRGNPEPHAPRSTTLDCFVGIGLLAMTQKYI
jgi:hypothetical protein